MRIKPTPDQYSMSKRLDKIRYIGPEWIKDFAYQIQTKFFQDQRDLILDISQIDFITLFEWMSVIACLESQLKSVRDIRSIRIDAKGENNFQIVPVQDLIRHEKGESIQFSSIEINESERIYNILGYIESLGGFSVLHYPGLGYQGIASEVTKSRAFYSRKPDDPRGPTVLFPMRRIESKEHCRDFVMNRPLGSWRDAMAEKFRTASVFWSEEFWRVICYELCANIWEHSNSTGFLSARVVEPYGENQGDFLHRWQLTYGDIIDKDQKRWMKDGLLEIVVADCGNGIVNTLEKTYRETHKLNISAPVNAKDILCFAFDEVGTSKKRYDNWASARHALSRILRIVGKYGGSLRIRSGGHEAVYRGKGINSFKRLRDKMGIAPTVDRHFEFFLGGTQLQILLPLYIPDKVSTAINRRSVLEVALPNSYQIQLQHPIGHLVPLLEEIKQPEPWVGEEETQFFQSACERLCRRLLDRRKDEVLVLDFSYLKWTTEQFETLLHLLQNVLQHRPVLLIELDPDLVNQAIALEEVFSSTQISSVFSDNSDGFAGKAIGELSVQTYLETYRGIHATLFGLDRDGRQVIFGLPSRVYEKALLELVYEPQTVEGLCQSYGLIGEDKNQFKAILNGPNSIFVKKEDGCWDCMWDEYMLAAQYHRSLSRNFDHVANNCRAWRGRKKEPLNIPPPSWGEGPVFQPFVEFPETETDTGEEIFYLPWAREWRKEFLECALILSRERYADEVARRLIYRLDRLLQSIGHSLQDVKTLACVTAPSMLLTEAIHRCWPFEYSVPTVADLGYYILLGSDLELSPRLLGSGGIVIVQDVIDKQNVTKKLVTFIQRQSQLMEEQNQGQRAEIIAQISFVRLHDPEILKETRSTGTDETWVTTTEMGDKVLCHSMIEVPRPFCGIQPDTSKEDSRLFWIEPRSLRPFRYSRLRSETPETDPKQKRRRECIQSFDDPEIGPLFSAGHYVYGDRHYSVVVNIPQLARSEIGDQIASDLAAICEGDESRVRAHWERPEGQKLKGDVTGVLMPLHSQIHHLWPKIEAIIAQHGRRQPAWYLSATLLYGSGPSYRMPEQLTYQLRSVVENLKTIKAKQQLNDAHKIRLLILDDAMISGRTGETIISNLMRLISEVTNKGKDPCPVEWIRYFSILNQCSYARNELFQNMTVIGGELGINIIFEDFAPFMGVKTYDSDNCPICKRYERLKKLKKVTLSRHAHDATYWIDKTLLELYPIAVDGFDFHKKAGPLLPRSLNVLPQQHGSPYLHTARFADTAIWQFQELMYLNQPPGIVLKSLSGAFPEKEQEQLTNASPGKVAKLEAISVEYEHYRWAVLDWCIRNWVLVEFDRAESKFFQRAREEVTSNTALLPSLLESLSAIHRKEDVREFIKFCIQHLASLEMERAKKNNSSNFDQRALDLDMSLTLFFLAVPYEELSNEVIKENSYLAILDKVFEEMGEHNLSLLRNLKMCLSRNPRFPQPDWALSVIGEALFRGARTRSKPVHPLLLPRALDDITVSPLDPSKRRILEGSLATFLTAVEDLFAYSPLSCLSEWASEGNIIMEWLKLDPEDHLASDLPRGYDIFRESLDPDRKWCLEFNDAFHPSLADLQIRMESREKAINDDLKKNSINAKINLIWTVELDNDQYRILTHVNHFIECIVNLALNPIHQFPLNIEMTSAINISNPPDRLNGIKRSVCFTILTQFQNFCSAMKDINSGPNVAADLKYLEPFGVKMLKLREPLEHDIQKGYTTAIDFLVPLGFSLPI